MNAFAETLKTWRGQKRMSQLALANAAQVSPRHISYLETGKSLPSRQMVLRLADALSVPKHARNDWLMSAGYAPTYVRRDIQSDELSPFIKVVERLLVRHDPYPGWALDGEWKLIRSNKAGATILRHLGLAHGESLVEAIVEDPTLNGRLVNWREAIAHLSHRLHGEAQKRLDTATKATAAKLSQLSPANRIVGSAITVPTLLEITGLEIALTSIQAMFNTAEDLTLSDLRIELFYPIDLPSENNLAKIVNPII